MPNVSRVSTVQPPQGRVTDLLKVKVSENDPALKATATAFGFKVSGQATNNGIIASFMQLQFDGKKVDLQISRGDTGQQVLAKLSKALPKGYEARVLSLEKSKPPQYTIGIARKQGAPPRVDVAKIPTSIAANQASANVSASFWVNLMPGAPRPNAIAAVKIQGTGFADAPPKFAVKSIAVYEKGTHKLVATIKNPKLVDSETVWGQKTQTYRLEVPKKDLDLNKQYTFVAETGINGSKAQQVRSDYVKIGKAY
jgi:hypothetical protein